MSNPDPNEMPEEIWVRHAQCGKNSKGERLSAVENIPSSTRDHGRIKYTRDDLAPTSQWRDISVDEPPEGISVLLAYKNSMKKFVANNAHIPDWCFEARPYCILGSGGAKSWHREATHWMPLPDAPPTKDLAAAGKEKS